MVARDRFRKRFSGLRDLSVPPWRAFGQRGQSLGFLVNLLAARSCFPDRVPTVVPRTPGVSWPYAHPYRSALQVDDLHVAPLLAQVLGDEPAVAMMWLILAAQETPFVECVSVQFLDLARCHQA